MRPLASLSQLEKRDLTLLRLLEEIPAEDSTAKNGSVPSERQKPVGGEAGGDKSPPARAKTISLVYRCLLFDDRIPEDRKRVGPGVRRVGDRNGSRFESVIGMPTDQWIDEPSEGGFARRGRIDPAELDCGSR
jgi:hypothetical protein